MIYDVWVMFFLLVYCNLICVVNLSYLIGFLYLPSSDELSEQQLVEQCRLLTTLSHVLLRLTVGLANKLAK